MNGQLYASATSISGNPQVRTGCEAGWVLEAVWNA